LEREETEGEGGVNPSPVFQKRGMAEDLERKKGNKGQK
jgi:hypothetical protein